MNLYNNTNILKNLFSRQCLYEIELILKDYNLLVTKIIINKLKKLEKKDRITQTDLLTDIVKLQCVLMESFSIAVYAINYIKTSFGENTAGNDLVRFKKKSELSKKNVENVIISELKSNLFLRSVHTKCHKTIDRNLSAKLSKKHGVKKLRKLRIRNFTIKL